MTNHLLEELAHVAHGYDNKQLTMYDDEMIGHVETLSSNFNGLADAVMKAEVLGEILKTEAGKTFSALVERRMSEKEAEFKARVESLKEAPHLSNSFG